MTNFNLFDDRRSAFLPLVYTRPVAALRVGILTIQGKWQLALQGNGGFVTENYLQALFPAVDSDLHINGRLLPTTDIVSAVQRLEPGDRLIFDEQILAYRTPDTRAQDVKFEGDPLLLEHITDLFTKNAIALKLDFDYYKAENTGEHSATILGKDVFIAPDAKLGAGCVINAETGPVYIGPGTEIMEGSMIRGPFALLDHSVIKMGAKIYGATTIGPWSKIGGEVSNSVVQGYSNKGHDGFMGNSLLGMWCNLGADTNTSNLKNNYGNVRIWNYSTESYEDSAQIFCGLIMGDHSKSAINTQFNTGTTVGVSANIFDNGFPPKFIPSFSWGGGSGSQEFDLDKAVEVARKVCARRDVLLSPEDQDLLRHIFDESKRFRG